MSTGNGASVSRRVVCSLCVVLWCGALFSWFLAMTINLRTCDPDDERQRNYKVVCVCTCAREILLFVGISSNRPCPGSGLPSIYTTVIHWRDHNFRTVVNGPAAFAVRRSPSPSTFVDKTENTICALSTCLILMANGHASTQLAIRAKFRFSLPLRLSLSLSLRRRAYVCSFFVVCVFFCPRFA